MGAMTKNIPKYVYGEHMMLITDTGDPPGCEVIRGHVTLEEARGTLAEPGLPVVARIEHAYGRWSMETSLSFDVALAEYETPGRGRFPITRCYWEESPRRPLDTVPPSAVQ